MKSRNTHTVQDIENWMHDITVQIQNAETKIKKKALLKKLKTLERHYNSCQEKHFNGKKYPIKRKPENISKKELLELIDSVNVKGDSPKDDATIQATQYGSELDVTGVFISKE